MKAKELMIGDWVKVGSRYLRIDSICDNIVNLEFCNGELDEYIREADLEPIPLTAEILEKNGFRYEHNYGQFYRSILGDYAKDKEPTVNIGWNSRNEMCEWDIADGHRGASYGHNPLFVHELQHALKVCKLWDLADNFKVEE